MKKFVKSAALLSAFAIFFSSCLKDKGFENNEYGINSPDDSPAAVGFKDGIKPAVVLGVGADATPQTVSFLLIYTGAAAPSTDITVNIAYDSTIINAYNARFGTNIRPLLPSAVNLPATVVIPAGQRNVMYTVTLNNASLLNPSLQYGLGIRIVSADKGTAVAGNLGVIPVIFNIKNKYDGVWSLDFSNYHPSLNPGYTGATTEVELQTTGPNSVTLYWSDEAIFCIPAILGGAFSCFGAQIEGITVNPTTNKVTVTNVDPTGTVVYVMNSSFDSRYEMTPAPAKIFAKWGYNNPGGVFNPAATREWTQTFTYVGPRP